MRLKWEYMLTAIFLLFAIIFLLLIGLEVNLGQSYRTQKLNELNNVPSAGFSMDNIPHYQFNGKIIADYPEIVARPLFFKSREPIIIDDIEEVLLEEAKVLAPLSLDLAGIISTPEGIFALFQDPKAKSHEKKFERLAQGDDINGWQLKEIQNDRVILVSGAKEKELLLSKPRVVAHAKNRKRQRSNPFNKKTRK